MRRALGKGLSQLIGEQEDASIREAHVDAIVPNPHQPRKSFDEESLRELANSIAQVGVVQPLVVRPLDAEKYELIAGERRLRAAKLAGLETVPIVVRSATDMLSMQIALIENLQREDISPLDAAEAYQELLEMHGLTQEDLAHRVGKSRSTVANTMRLLRLPEDIRDSLASGRITEGHARALLQFDTETEQRIVHQRILQENLSVRDVEKIAQGATTNKKQRAAINAPLYQPNPLDAPLSEYFGTPVKVHRRGFGGKIEIEFFGDEDLDRILERLGFRY